jgi:exopolysaccharide production protein ExoZ
MPERDRRLPSVQALRGVAASLVVYHHLARLFRAGNPSPSWIYRCGLGNLGACGVDIFFVISGFIMVYTTVGKAGTRDALTFLERRIRRIYPLYWVWTSLLLALWLMGIAKLGGVDQRQLYSISYLFKSYLLIPTLNGQYFDPLLAPGWTLCFEMFFYLLFSCSILLGLRSGKLPFLAVAFSVLAPLSMFVPGGGLAYLVSDPIIIEFLYGVLAAELLLHVNNTRLRFTRGLPIALMTIGAAALLCTVKLQNPDHLRFFSYGIPALCIVFGATMLGPMPAPRLLVYLGDCSYSIYLTHGFFVMVYASALKHSPAFNRLPPDGVILLAGAITIALSSFSYGLVEKPLTRWLIAVPSLRPKAQGSTPRPEPSWQSG